ncbi:helicase-related protein [Amycolatopsis vancoresmycina]|uniref:Helicase domain-containing protein n=1 Tax=Amycolatopsis vancoresmycina DSM 44592 TaxID=1292037 RepID=R1G8B4_9PSEU|nr:helicase-related protein [Amycolatopsis vancoresmycina]EOD67657.1 helicase domain-containing protein [Amycolatopsis vancoresmycina DSM 44592]
MSDFAAGSLVRARGRDWVVLPDSADDLLVVRPLGGRDDEVAGILTAIEQVSHATFAAPDPADAGNAVSAGLLRTALQVGFRSTAGPFRSMAGLAVEPRPYQLVPLLMALRQDTVRMLIADDVGIGKTVEAGLIAAELLAQGSALGLTVLCAPALAEQWQAELASKFRIDAELVLPGTVKRLERNRLDDESIFELYPHTIVSTDFIKSPRHRDDFVRACPDLVIVDEAHTCVADGSSSGERTLRYDLVRRLAENRSRHLLLVTATPHSGKDEGFRNLIALLDPELRGLDLGSAKGRERLARHMVQRRRAHIRKFVEDTPFPEDRKVQERKYYLTNDYAKLFGAVLSYARETVRDQTGGPLRQRVRYWSALALLRALASSPKAAAATLRTRAQAAGATSTEEADRIGRATVLDLAEDEAAESVDITPGADDVAEGGNTERRRLLEFARRAEQLEGPGDAKLACLDETVQSLLGDGYDPVIFCRFIDTAEYVAEHLRGSLDRAATVAAVTGALSPSVRESTIGELTSQPGRHVLVATDCLSEGVNLQEYFQAVVHYDLAWNPTRHEQREGRVDRFGQPRKEVRAVTVIGADNQIDEIVMRVLLRKHNEIRKQLGISVPVPDSANAVVEAVLEELFVTAPVAEQPMLEGFEDALAAHRKSLHEEWDSYADKENAALTKFAQTGIKPDEVAAELAEVRASLGANTEITGFVRESLDALGSSITLKPDGFDAVTTTLPWGLQDALPPGHAEPLPFRSELPVRPKHAHLDRTDLSVAAIARYVLDSALDPRTPGPRPARRCGAMRTDAVTRRTTQLLLRFRMHVRLPGRDGVRTMVAEEARTVAFRGRPDEPEWLSTAEVEALLATQPSGNLALEQAQDDLQRAVGQLDKLRDALDEQAAEVADRLRESHTRVRTASRQAGVSKIEVQAHTPVDVLGVYVYLPVPAGVR